MDPKLRNDTAPSNGMASVQIDPVTFGRVIESLDNLTKTVHSMDKKLDNELSEIKKAIGGKPDMEDMERKLQDYGFDDPSEIKKDAQFVRKERLKHEKYDGIKTRVIQVVLTALIMGVLTWTGSAIYEKIKEDVRQEQHP